VIFGNGAPAMRQTFAWDSIGRGKFVRREYIPILTEPGKGLYDPQLDWDIGGDMIVRATGTKITRGVVLIDVLDVDNANWNGWFVQPRATTLRERQQGLVRVQKL
jgi:hypothetical protein